jgi:hypothetical protein
MGLPGESIPIIVEPVRLPDPAREDKDPVPEPCPVEPEAPVKEPVTA